jgi:hypothetical protein
MLKKVCYKCKQKFSSTEMIPFTLSADGEYEPWTEERYAWYRSRWKKYPHLVWLCHNCYHGMKVK